MVILKKKFVKWALLTMLVALIAGGIIVYKMYNKPHRNVLTSAATDVNATELVNQYETEENKANTLYLDKVLNVSGEVTDIAKNQKDETVITLKGSDMGGVLCTLEGKEQSGLQKGNTVKLQGICTGYLTDVVLVRCYFKSE